MSTLKVLGKAYASDLIKPAQFEALSFETLTEQVKEKYRANGLLAENINHNNLPVTPETDIARVNQAIQNIQGELSIIRRLIKESSEHPEIITRLQEIEALFIIQLRIILRELKLEIDVRTAPYKRFYNNIFSPLYNWRYIGYMLIPGLLYNGANGDPGSNITDVM